MKPSVVFFAMESLRQMFEAGRRHFKFRRKCYTRMQCFIYTAICICRSSHFDFSLLGPNFRKKMDLRMEKTMVGKVIRELQFLSRAKIFLEMCPGPVGVSCHIHIALYMDTRLNIQNANSRLLYPSVYLCHTEVVHVLGGGNTCTC